MRIRSRSPRRIRCALKQVYDSSEYFVAVQDIPRALWRRWYVSHAAVQPLPSSPAMASLSKATRKAVPGCETWLRKFMENPSFTRDIEGVRREAGLVSEFFGEILKASTHHLVEADDAAFGKHLVVRVGDKASMVPDGTARPVVGIVTHLDTVYPSELLRSPRWLKVCSENDIDALSCHAGISISKEKRVEIASRLPHLGPLIYGGGSMDIKGGTVVAGATLDLISNLHPEVFQSVEWRILANAAEEEMAPCFGRIARHELKNAIFCLVFEAGNFLPTKSRDAGSWSLVCGRKGRANWELEADGIEAHAGNGHREGSSAITRLAEVILELEGWTDYDKDVTLNVGTISGGTACNTVPGFAQAQLEMRAFHADTFQNTALRVEALCAKHGVRAIRHNIIEPWPANEDTETLIASWETAAAALGHSIVTEFRGGVSDGNRLWDICPTIDGCGIPGYNAHVSGLPEPECAALGPLADKLQLNVLGILCALSSQGVKPATKVLETYRIRSRG